MKGGFEPLKSMHPSAGATSFDNQVFQTVGTKLGFSAGQTEHLNDTNTQINTVSISLDFDSLAQFCIRLSAYGLDNTDAIYRTLPDSYKAKGAIYENKIDLQNVFGNLSAAGGWLFTNSSQEELGNSPKFVNGRQQGEIFTPIEIDWEKLGDFLMEIGTQYGGRAYTYCEPFDGDPICLFHIGYRLSGEYGDVPDNKLLPEDMSLAALRALW